MSKNFVKIVLAYHLLHSIEYTLRLKKDTRGGWKIKQGLATHQVVTVGLPGINEEQIHYLRRATEADGEHKEIYTNLGIDYKKVIKREGTTFKNRGL
ncbi:MAG: hypothetical protein AB1567_04300 [bacterium]